MYYHSDTDMTAVQPMLFNRSRLPLFRFCKLISRDLLPPGVRACRRRLLAVAATAAFAGALGGFAPSSRALAESGDANRVTVFKSPTCGCCVAWVEHLEE
ncbi:MAG: hypothetical protein DWQ08_11815, partial [Proteobacteria bacterium]